MGSARRTERGIGVNRTANVRFKRCLLGVGRARVRVCGLIVALMLNAAPQRGWTQWESFEFEAMGTLISGELFHAEAALRTTRYDQSLLEAGCETGSRSNNACRSQCQI